MTQLGEHDSMKRVLFVSLAFPPLAVVGAYRVAKFCKYISCAGFRPIVLTENIREMAPMDWATLEDLGDEVEIVRTLNLQPFYWWDSRGRKAAAQPTPAPVVAAPATGDSTTAEKPRRFSLREMARRWLRFVRTALTVPDARLAWIPQSIIPGMRLIRREKIDVIFSSSPGPTNHILAYLLARLSGRPHIVDYRDLWTISGGYFSRNLPQFLRRYDTFWERRILKHCHGVVVATRTFKENLVAGFDDLGIEDKTTVIYNGVDEDDYKNFDTALPANQRFTISYFGNLYGFRNPMQFIQALAGWVNTRSEIKSRVKVDFWGSCDAGYMLDISRYRLNNVVAFNSRISQRDAMQKMLETDLLLLIQGTDPRAADAIPTKLFEYLVTGKPILAFFPEGEAADMLAEDENHLVVSHPDTERIAAYLQRRFSIWENAGDSREIKIEIAPSFSRKRQAQQLAEFITLILQNQR